ncbi:unnamed protein product [Cylicocyclus nassatus]|uniref:Uncharacterized protein n=1 Tax=Cylicocyclus nassatus TaxID=53992 RepID=A0AA36HCQ2_CYLNA|nr:unnamed protein product [Cylicocyclus nassatus]
MNFGNPTNRCFTLLIEPKFAPFYYRSEQPHAFFESGGCAKARLRILFEVVELQDLIHSNAYFSQDRPQTSISIAPSHPSSLIQGKKFDRRS